MTSDYDIVVVGGSIVGLTTTLALAQLGFKLALVEPNFHSPTMPGNFDPRNFALTLTSIRILENLGVWSGLDATRNAEIRHMSVWDANSNGRIEFSPHRVGARSFGVITENANLLQALQAETRRQGNVSVVEDAASQIVVSADHRSIGLASGDELHARIVVCCDGGNSPMRLQLGILAEQQPYEQRALVCNVQTEESHQHVARQVFHGSGPLAFLPLADERQSAIVWTNTETACAELMALSAETFIERLNNAFAHTDSKKSLLRPAIRSLKLTSERFDFPLSRMHASRYDAERAVLVGDSAHIIHPLAGQGLNLGIMDAAVLAHVLKYDAAGGLASILERPQPALRRYARWRASDNDLMLRATDSLNALFSRREGFAKILRGTGLNTSNKIAPLMRLFTLHAMGLAGELPTLAKESRH